MQISRSVGVVQFIRVSPLVRNAALSRGHRLVQPSSLCDVMSWPLPPWDRAAPNLRFGYASEGLETEAHRRRCFTPPEAHILGLALPSRSTPTTASPDIFWQSKPHSKIGKQCKTSVARTGPPITRLASRSGKTDTRGPKPRLRNGRNSAHC